MIFNKESKNNQKYKALCLQGLQLLNQKTKELSFVFPSKWFSTKNVKIKRNIRLFPCKACNFNHKPKKLSFVFPRKWFSTKNVKITKKKKVCFQSISKGGNSRQTDGRTDRCSGTFACTLHYLWCPSINVSSVILFPILLDMLRTSFLLQKLRKEVTS